MYLLTGSGSSLFSIISAVSIRLLYQEKSSCNSCRNVLTYKYFLMQFKEVLLFSQIQKFFNIHYYLYCISQFSLTICYNVFFYLIRILSWYKFIVSSANEALRVEFSTFLKLYVELRANQGKWLLGKFTSNFAWGWGSAQTPGQAEPVFTRPRVLRFRLRAARLLIASRPNAPLRGLNVGLCGDR